MKRKVLKASILMASATGLLGVLASSAEAVEPAFRHTANHSEPVR